LLDTSSEATIVPAHLVNKIDITSTTHSLRAANGTSIPLLGEITLPMQIGEINMSITALVSEHIAEVMLGIDWLTMNKIIWNFHQSNVKIGNKYHKLKTQINDGQWCRRVTLQETVYPSQK